MDPNFVQLTGKKLNRNMRRRQTNEKWKANTEAQALVPAQTFPNPYMANNSQSQPPSIYPGAPPNMWAPNFPMQTMQQDPWSNPQPWNPDNTFISQPGAMYEGSFQPYNVEQPLPNQYNNMITSECWSQTPLPPPAAPGQVNQGKQKKQKKQPKQLPKKSKIPELSFEEKQKRNAELRLIQEKYRQVVMIHRVVSQNQKEAPPVAKKPKAPAPKTQTVISKPPTVPVSKNLKVTATNTQTVAVSKNPTVPVTNKPTLVPNKPTAAVTPSKKPVIQQIKPNVYAVYGSISTITSGQGSHLPGKKRYTAKKKKKQGHQVQAVNTYNSGVSSTSQYQAPHQDEPEDLTDDLAPNMTGGQQQTGAQTATTENKLNFKFHRNVQKNPDWLEYQNKFRRIGGGSPEPPAAAAADDVKVKQEPGAPSNTGIIFDEDVEMKEATVNTNIDTSDLKVAVTTRPYLYLTEEQVKGIDEALVDKIQDAIFNPHRPYVPTFENIPVHDLGHLPINCRSPKDLIWLHETLSAIPTPTPNVELVIRPQAAMPNMVKVELFVPNYSGSLEELRYLLQKQNHWYDMSSWMLVKSEKQGDDPSNYSLEYRVPEKEALIIDNRDRRVAYSLGTCFATVSDDAKENEKLFKHRNVAQHLQVCVLTEPFRYLTLLEVELIKLALIYKLEKDVRSDNGYIPTFRGCPSHYKGGLKMWCESDRDLKWLKDAVNSLVSPAIGTRLTIKEQAAIPQRAKMTIVVPTTEDESFIIKVLKSQNSWCDIDSWTLFSTWLDAKSNVVCVFYIPHKHIRIIKDRNCRLSFLLGYVKADITTE